MFDFVKVLINAISVKEGGSLVVLNQLLRELIKINPDDLWYVATNPVVANKVFTASNVKRLVFDWTEKSPFHLFYWYEWTLPKKIKLLGIDALFAQTNYLPRRYLNCPSLLLIQHAGHFSNTFKSLMAKARNNFPANMSFRMKGRWVRHSVKNCSRLTVQTHTLARAIADDMALEVDSVNVIPHGCGQMTYGESRDYPESDSPGSHRWRIGYITKYGVQKDFESLIAAISILDNHGHDVTLVLSLDETTEEYALIDSLLTQHGVDKLLENHGEIEVAKIEQLYDSLDVFVFPSLCESFGFPLLEAMARGIPVVAADTDSNCELAENAATIFDSMNAEDLAEKIIALMSDEVSYHRHSVRSLENAHRYNWQEAAISTYSVLQEMVDVKSGNA